MAEAGVKGNIDDQWMSANKVLDTSNTNTNSNSEKNAAITTNATANVVPKSSPAGIRNLVEPSIKGNNKTANQVLEPSYRSISSSSSSSSSENKATITTKSTSIETSKSKIHQNVVPKSSPAGVSEMHFYFLFFC